MKQTGSNTMIVALVLSLICGSSVAQSSRCVQGENCRLPDCFCPTFQHPFYHDIKDIPQMVYFAFDDALQGQVGRFYRQLFTKDHRNPNGCPISMSLYVQDQWTSYAMVNSYYRRGMEIGSHSVTHTDVNTEQKLLFEAGRQRDNLTRAGHVPREQIQGWRSPNLKTAGDVQPDVLKDLGYTYDISLTYTRHKADEPIPWPYTLDFGYPYGCSIRPCPRSTSPHPGFWEVPVPSLYDPESGYPCAYVDSCRPSDEAAAVEYLWSNFEKVYKSNRAPFGLNMHAAWFYNAQYMRASLTFLRRLLSLPDVYVLNVRQVLAWMKSPVSSVRQVIVWMKSPVKVSDVSKLSEWSCEDATPFSNSHDTTRNPIGFTKPPLPHLIQETAGTRYPHWVTRQPPATTRTPHVRTYRPLSGTYRPPVRTYQPPNRTYQPSNRTYKPPNRTYQPPNRTFRPPNRTYQPPNRTYQPPNKTYRPPNRTHQSPKTTYSPPFLTYQPPNRTYRPPNRTYQPPNRTFRPPNQTKRPQNSVFHIPLSFIPVPSNIGNSGSSSSNLNSGTDSKQHNTSSGFHSGMDTIGNNIGSNLQGGTGSIGHSGGHDANLHLHNSGGEDHKEKPAKPSPVLIKVNYHRINPANGNNIVSNSNAGQKEETGNGGQSVGTAEKDGVDGSGIGACVQEVTCSLPSCVCRSLVPPAKLGVEKTPQVVYLTFTGAVNGFNYQRVLNLLTSRRNPNNCPISATFFVPLSGNYAPYVQSLRSRGDEIAMYGSGPYMFDHFSSIKQQVQNEVEKFRNHERQSGLNLETDLVHLGYRHPDGTSLGNGMVEGLHAGNISYDASLVTSRHAGSDDVIPWPYTLDYGWKDCRSNDSQCLSGRYPGLWEVPLVPLVDRTKLTTCTYADGCHSHPASSEDVATFYMDNLKHALDTNRAPMGLHLRYHWFSDPLFYSNLRGLQIFLDAILGSRDDVFVISVEKMLDWMKSPLSLDRIAESWKC